MQLDKWCYYMGMVRESDAENFICFGPLHNGDVVVPEMLRSRRPKGSPSWCQACVNEDRNEEELDPQ